jgi:hypothetical protein
VAQELMWDQIQSVYRGQASGGVVVLVEEDAMQVALKKAGKSVFETDWWLETLTDVLEHWGIYAKRWVDEATLVPRARFTAGEPKQDNPADSGSGSSSTGGPLTTRILSGKLAEDQAKE